jgi:hypothetical protein
MAKISLREYIHKIESLIDRGDTDQAIFHSKSILKTYPKHIDSYRLLGKAFLEKKKFGDAADIFQRVLSSVADDFISHIGMSIIREDENNLDEAIWHMERAFETQPSNKTVQEELIKLYSMRDGVTPPKIRLTRGALVRMYVKGELYSQAIAEIQAALSEDPNRIDLEVILAQLYNLMGQNVEAMEICSKLISKLPYCYEANLILTKLLPGTGRSEDERIFRQRVIELDPYFEFVDESITSTTDVPDNKIMLDYLDYDGTQFDQIKPEWAESIGVDLNVETSSEDEETDDWFNFEQSSEDEHNNSEIEESEFVNESTDETIISVSTRTDLTELLKSDESDESPLPEFIDSKEDSILPDWIKEAGWNETENENIEIQKGFNIVDENDSEIANELNDDYQVEIEPGEIPEWLKKIAPVDQISDLEKIDEDNSSYEGDQAFEKLFDQLSGTQESRLLSENLDPSLEWLKEFQSEGSEEFTPFEESLDQEMSQKSDSELGTTESIYDVKSDHAAGEEVLLFEETDTDQTESSNLISESTIELIVSDQIDSDLERAEAVTETQESPEESPEELSKEEPSESSESSMSWLEALSEGEILNQTEDIEITGDKTDFPEWMKALDKEDIETEEGKMVQSVSTDEELTTESSFDLPDWLKFEDDEENERSEVEFSSIPSEVQSLSKEESLLEESDDDEDDVEADKWISEISQKDSIEKLESVSGEEEPAVESIESEEKIFGEEIGEEQEDIDSALTWMESLALKHGASEDTLISKPEERDENPPDWIKALSSLDQTESEQVIIEPEENHELENEQESLTPDWLQALQIETSDTGSLYVESEKISDEINLVEEPVDIDLNTFTSGDTEEEVEEEIEELLRETGALANLLQDQNVEIVETDNISEEILEENQQMRQSDIGLSIEDEYQFETDISEDLADVEEVVKIAETVPDLSISKSSQERLDFAKQLIVKGKIDDALDIYNEFIHAELVLDQVIIDLQNALDSKYPIDINLWQALGDAQLRNNQLQEALNSYTKAEELLS